MMTYCRVLLIGFLSWGSLLFAAGVSVSAKPGQGITFSSDDNQFGLNLKTRMQLRNSYLTQPKASTDELQVKTVRFTTSGHLLDPNFRFTVQLAFGAGDFEKDNSSPLFDGFVEYLAWPNAQLRFGQFFVPFDRARTIREFSLQMVDRPEVVRELSLDRDFGIMLFSPDFLESKIGYAFFLGSGDGRNRVGGQSTGPLVTGRLTYRPFGLFDDDQEADLTQEGRVRLALGVAAGYNFQAKRAKSTTGNAFSYGTVDYHHFAADLVVKYSGFSLLAEALARGANRRLAEGSTEPTRSGYGYLVQAGQMVGQKTEVTARMEQMAAPSDTDRLLITALDQSGAQVGGGLNYYFNGHGLKLQADYFHLMGRKGGESQNAIRLQLDATL